MKMLPENYVPVMFVEFDCGETLYYQPHTFMLLNEQFSKVKNWERINLPKKAIELRDSNIGDPEVTY